MGWPTAKDVINSAAVGVGLIAFNGKLADPFASSDSNIGLLCQLLGELGQELARKREWVALQKEYTFVTATGTTDYALPSDFGAMIDQTGWNRTTTFPLGGPLSPQEWQFLAARVAGVTFRVLFRPADGVMRIRAPVPNAQTIAFEYRSKYWVGGTKEAPTASADLCWFDSLLLVRGLKAAFLRAKGFDSSSAEQDFADTYADVTADDAPAPVLNFAGGDGCEPLVGEDNLPLTGYGS